IDMGANRGEVETIIDVLGSDDRGDCLVMQLRPTSANPDDERRLEEQIASLTDARERPDKPGAAIIYASAPLEEGPGGGRGGARLREAGIPAFPTYERCASALAKVRTYYRFREENGVPVRAG